MAGKNVGGGQTGSEAPRSDAPAAAAAQPSANNNRPLTLDGLEGIDVGKMPTAAAVAAGKPVPAPEIPVEDCCGNCHYYRGLPGAQFKYGNCQESSPQAVPFRSVMHLEGNPLEPNKPPVTVLVTQQVDGYFPLTRADRWCGKHKLTDKPWRPMQADSQTVGGPQ